MFCRLKTFQIITIKHKKIVIRIFIYNKIYVKIYNIYGNLVTSLAADGNSSISVKELATGIYILEVSSQGKGISRKRFMKN